LQLCCRVKKKATRKKKRARIVGAGPGEQEEHELIHVAMGPDSPEPHAEPPFSIDPMHALHADSGSGSGSGKSVKRKAR
jgi:hypothetical protein